MEEDVQHVAGKTCVKCSEPAKYAGTDAKQAVYCKPCFITMVKHKFRSAISKRKMFKEGDERECLIVFDGSTSSCFLVHQIIEALQQNAYKRLMISPTFVVLVSSVEDDSISVVMNRFQEIKPLFPSPCIMVHLAAGLSTKKVEMKEKLQGTDQIPLYKNLLLSCKTSTAKEELRRILKEKTCSLIARSFSLFKVMLPDDADALGRLALTQLCLGRGGLLNEMTSIMDKRKNGITFIRPSREITDKEISIVSHLEGYENIAIRTNESIYSTPGSIQATTSKFVDNLLSEGFKSTISTVLSTASKLHTPIPEVVCPLCELGAVAQGEALCSCCYSLVSEMNDVNLFKKCFL